MDKLEEIAISLFRVTEGQKIVYIAPSDKLPDFSDHSPSSVTVMSSAGQVEIPFNRDDIAQVWGIVDAAVFGGEHVVLAWNLSSLLSYVRFYTKAKFKYGGTLFDMKVIERFLGIEKNPPKTFTEVVGRAKVLKMDKSYAPIWKEIHRPLVTEVVPAIETEGLIHVPTRRAVYTHYQIEWQAYGRMQAYGHSNGFNAHAIGKSGEYRPKGEGTTFVTMDFHAMEVFMLQYLSKCDGLLQVLNTGEDVYRGIYRCIADKPCGDKMRKLIKSSFLPVVYGMGVGALEKRLNVPEKTASNLMNKFHECFPKAFAFVRQHQQIGGVVRDYFGRPRTFKQNDHCVRNFMIQAPASIVCLEKLIALQAALGNIGKLSMHVHDGYAIVCHAGRSSDVYATAKTVLESESKMCPGLHLRANGEISTRLDQLKP